MKIKSDLAQTRRLEILKFWLKILIFLYEGIYKWCHKVGDSTSCIKDALTILPTHSARPPLTGHCVRIGVTNHSLAKTALLPALLRYDGGTEVNLLIAITATEKALKLSVALVQLDSFLVFLYCHSRCLPNDFINFRLCRETAKDDEPT